MKKIALLILLFPFWVNAQEKMLDSVTVVSSLQQQKVSSTGRSIYVIKAEQIRDLPAQSLDELLRYLPGMEVQMRGPAGGQSDLLIRGGTFQQVLVLLDGVRINDPLTGHFNSYMPVAMGEIERIEILKGPASALYGTDAVGGVVNIITRNFLQKSSHKGLQFKGQFTIGTYALANAEGGVHFQTDKTGFSAGILSNNSHGQPQRGLSGYYHNHTFSASITRKLSEQLMLSFRTALDDRDFAAQNFYTSFLSDTATEQVKSWWNQMQLAYKNGRHGWNWHTAYKQTRDEYFFRAGVTPNLNKSGLLQSQLHYSYNWGDAASITMGGQIIRKTIASNDRGNHEVAQGGLFALLHKQWGGWHINPAIRFDWNQASGWQPVPQIAFSYQHPSWIWRGVLGKSIRDADFTERYNNYNKSLVLSGNIGNPSLKTEKAINWETGLDYVGGDHWKWSATYFQKQYDELIDWVLTPYSGMPRTVNLQPSGNYFLATNIASFTSRGLETDLSWNKHFGENKTLRGSMGATWIETPGNTSLYLSAHARWLANYSLLLHLGNLRLSVNGLYKFRDQQAGNTQLVQLNRQYYLMNLKVETRVAQTRSWVFVQSDNLFNKNLADRFGVPLPGRWLMAGLRIR